MQTIRNTIIALILGIAFLLLGANLRTPVPMSTLVIREQIAAPAPPSPVVVTPATPMPLQNGTYEMNTACDTNPELRITRVTQSDTKTIIDLAFTSQGTSKIRTAAPGQQTAFYIADPDTRTEYKLLNVEGIAMEPVWTELTEVGQTVNFRLTFERIPDALTKFHLIEGKVISVTEDGLPAHNWTFMNVEL
jgi:hypothetical protein